MKTIRIAQKQQAQFNELIKRLNTARQEKEKIEKEIENIKEELFLDFNIDIDFIQESTKYESNAWILPITYTKACESIDTKALKMQDKTLYDTLLKQYHSYKKEYLRYGNPQKVTK